MPLLRKESDFFPDDLFALPVSDVPWWVAHVRPRREKALARYLLEKSIPFYLPQIEKRHRRGTRERVSYLPLFSGYVFFRGAPERLVAVNRSHLVATLIDVDDQELLTTELSQLHDLQSRGATLTPYPELVPGNRVRIVDGTFRGYVGVIERQSRPGRLIVTVSLIRKSVAVEFDREVIAPETTRPVSR